MVIPGYNVGQQLDKNSVHTNSPEEAGESYCHFIQYSGELQSSSKISEGTTIHVICTGILTIVLSTQIHCMYYPIPLQHFHFCGYQRTG